MLPPRHRKLKRGEHFFLFPFSGFFFRFFSFGTGIRTGRGEDRTSQRRSRSGRFDIRTDGRVCPGIAGPIGPTFGPIGPIIGPINPNREGDSVHGTTLATRRLRLVLSSRVGNPVETPPFTRLEKCDAFHARRLLLVPISDEIRQEGRCCSPENATRCCCPCSSALGPPNRADRGERAQVLDQHPVDGASALA